MVVSRGKWAQIRFVDTGCGSGALLTSREGDRASFVMGTQRSIIDFLNIHFCFMDSNPVRAALWHRMLTAGLIEGVIARHLEFSWMSTQALYIHSSQNLRGFCSRLVPRLAAALGAVCFLHSGWGDITELLK